MQTLNISGTAAAAIMRRSIADVSTTLNASTGNKSKTAGIDKNVSDKTNETDKYVEAEYIGNAFDKGVKMGETSEAYPPIPENVSPQSNELIRYISNNLDWQKRRG